MTRPLLIAFAAVFASNGCVDKGSLYSRAGTQSGVACQPGESECRGERVALCVDGEWVERACESLCRNARCVACEEGKKRCRDPYVLEECVQGELVEASCPTGMCANGQCGCRSGEYRCHADGRRERCGEEGVWAQDACPGAASLCAEGKCLQCEPGSARCVDPQNSVVCSESGIFNSTVCPTGCDSASGRCNSEPCVPDTQRCGSLHVVQACADDGMGFVDDHRCDTSQGEACREGRCESSCVLAQNALAPSGCEFIAPAPVGWYGFQQSQPEQPPEALFEVRPLLRLHLINPTHDLPAEVTYRLGNDTPGAVTVPPRSSRTVEMAGGMSPSRQSVRTSSSVSIRSNAPVYVVHDLRMQGNAVGPGGEVAQSGDTAFLLPRHLLGSRYRVLTQPHCENHDGRGPAQPGGFSVVAIGEELAVVSLELRGGTAPSADGRLRAYDAGESDTLDVAPGETLHFLSRAPNAVCGALTNAGTGNDLTGTLIESNAPLAVFNGGLSRVPYCVGCHVQTQLIEQLMPVNLWGSSFAISVRHIPYGSGSEANDEQWVVVTDTDQTLLQFDQAMTCVASSGASNLLATAGDACTFNSATPGHPSTFHLNAAESGGAAVEVPVLVGRYFYTGASVAIGGSTFSLERPVRFWRSEYLVQAAGNASNRVLLIVPQGRPVSMDGQELTGTRGVGPSGHDIVETNVSTGLHAFASDGKFGVFVYGYEGSASIRATNAYTYSGPVGFQDAL